MLESLNLDRSKLNGALLIDKHEGITSFGVVHQVKKLLSQRYGLSFKKLPKVGHGGTLDPFATGLLVVLIGKASKLADYFLGSKKYYEGTFEFGRSSNTSDITGDSFVKNDIFPDSKDSIQSAADSFLKQTYFQTPPMYSAKKHQGKPLYQLARKGIEIEREPKACQLYDFQIHSYSTPDATFSVSCSAGTYIRTLSEDLASKLKTIGLLKKLRRIQSGPFETSTALSIDAMKDLLEKDTQMNFNELPNWIGFNSLLNSYPSIEIDRTNLFQLKKAVSNPSILDHIFLQNKDSIDWRTIDANLLTFKHYNHLVGVARKSKDGFKVDKTFSIPDKN